ncbi:arylsulfatase-like [Branchiostoma floridae]|uniref:Arylsulfatase n=1 Tax=Branchiostoma floridae TaxID=7739 RepID=A0A9J7M2F9_BRAFL|nr:arylsulfatase-like [Branchiostoma floridae]
MGQTVAFYRNYVTAVTGYMLVTVVLVTVFLLHDGIGALKTKTSRDERSKLKTTVPVKPNIILMLADDMGWGDLCSYGHPTQECGEIDKMAAEGMRFTQWYSADSLCSPSRAAILTGRLPVRVGVWGGSRVFLPASTGGLPRDETTIAELLKEAGYATGMVGKWHLGINEFLPGDGRHLPHHHGFDFVGTNLPFTNHWACDESKVHMESPDPMLCFKYWNATLVQQPFRHDNLTTSFLQDSVAFMHNNKDTPFFLYLSFAHMHTDMFSAPRFRETSRRGRYGDGLRELDWAVGEVLKTLVSLQIQHRTLVIFLSDHGGHLEICTEGGSNGILKGGKASTWDGGLRVPGIAWWPGVVAPGQVSQHLVSSMDVFQTAAELAGVTPPKDRIYDGKSLVPILLEKTAAVPTSKSPPSPRTLFHYCSNRLMAVRYGEYKAHFYSMELPGMDYTQFCPSGVPIADYYTSFDCYGPEITQHEPPLLFNINIDPGELYPLPAEDYKDVLIKILLEKLKHEISMEPGKAQCEEGSETVQPCCKPPFCTCNYEPQREDG